MNHKINIKSLIPFIIINDNLDRFGSDYDGGYIFPNNIYKNAKQIVSLGIKDDWNLEMDFIKSRENRFSPPLKLIAYDLVVDEWFFFKCFIGFFLKGYFNKSFRNLLLIPKFYSFFRKSTNVKYFKRGVSGNKPTYTSLKEILSHKDIEDSLILSIDIEGDEYSIIDDINEFQYKIDAFVIEFHDIDKKKKEFNDVINQLNNHYRIVHLHLNNNSIPLEEGISSVIEISFVNKKYSTEKLNSYIIPTHLDRPCNSNIPDFKSKLICND